MAEIAQQLQDRGPDIGWGHTVVDVLKDVGSERARALLRRIALGELSPGNEDWAARALIASDRGEAWNLLSSNSPQALTTALNVLDGQKVDESHMPLLKKCLAGKDALVSWRAAAVMADGAYDKLAVGTVEAIGQSLAAVTDLPGVDAPDPTGYRFGVVYTLGEQYYSRYANALEHAHVDNAVLHRLATRLLGRARDTVILALANRGDKSLREEIIKLAQAPQAGLFRAWAATALGQIGTQADLPLLRSLAESDPMVRKGPLPPPQPTDRLGPTYPVRQAAKAAIRTIETGGRERAAK